jgi:hypothetical protein
MSKDKLVEILEKYPIARYAVSALAVLAVSAIVGTAVRNARLRHDVESYGGHLGSVPVASHQVLR